MTTTVAFPSPTSFVYPKNNFGKLSALRGLTRFNRNAFIEYTDRTPFNVENEHILVGLLQQLAIDPEWELDYVVEYVRFRSYSLCTLFKITSPNRVGDTIKDGFYREGTLEQWCLIENDNKYVAKTVRYSDLAPVVPLYTTRTDHGYKHNLHRKRDAAPSGELAIIGINLVELAIGWWLYMHDPKHIGRGISGYLADYPLVYAQLYHNQMAFYNVIHDCIVNNVSVDQLIKTNPVNFITTNEDGLLKELVIFLVEDLTKNRLMDLGHLMSKLVSIYQPNYENWVPAGKFGLLSQTCWIWEPAILKLQELYLTIANRNEYKAGDINTPVSRAIPAMVNNYYRIQDPVFKRHFTDLAKRVQMLNNLNISGK